MNKILKQYNHKYGDVLKHITAAILLFFVMFLYHGNAFGQNIETPTTKETNIIGQGFAHNNFGRIILKISNDSHADINHVDDKIIITFENEVSANLSSITQEIKNYVIDTQLSNDKKILNILLPNSNFRIRKFFGENFIGLDIIRVNNQQSRPHKTAISGAIPTPKTKPSYKLIQIEDEIKQLKKQLKEDEEKSVIEEMWTRIFPIDKPSFFESFFLNEGAPKTKPISPEQKRIDRIEKLEKQRKAEMDKEKLLLRSKLDELNKTRQQRIEKARQELLDLETIKREGITRSQLEDARKRSDLIAAAEEASRRERTLILSKETIEDGEKITFSWTRNVASAFFARGRYVWAVFNKDAILEASGIENNKYFTQLKPLNIKGYSVLSFKLKDQYDITHKVENKKPINITASLNGFNWELTIKKHNPLEEGSGIVKNAIQVTAGLSQRGPTILIDAENAVPPVSIIDMDVGDTLYITPLYQDATGIAIKRNFVDFNLPPTAQGIVIAKKSDGLNYTIEDKGIEVFSKNRLNISKDLYQHEDSIESEVKTKREKKKVLQTQTIFPFNYIAFKNDTKEATKEINKDNEKGTEDTKNTENQHDEEIFNEYADAENAIEDITFIESRQKLFGELTEAEDKEKTKKRLEIAKYYFSLKMYEETLGVVHAIKLNDPIFEGMQEVDLIEAASNYMIRRYKKSAKQFRPLAIEADGEASYTEIRLWQWMSDYKLGIINRKKLKPELPIEFIDSYDQFLQEYPSDIRYEIGLLVADFMVKNNLSEDAKNILNIISYDGIPNDYANDTTFLKGKIAALGNDVEAAIAILEPLSNDVTDRHNRAKSLYELTKIRLINSIIDTEEAINSLGTIGTIWRGDNLELDVLKLIGQLYIQENKYYEGLKAWQVLVTNFPNTKESLFIAGKMKKTFINLFDKGTAYDLSPFEALTLYFSFRELTPAGDIGDRITQQLTEHFINADLLDNATDIIAHQIRFRTSGDLKHLLSLKLAKLFLENKKPVEAIKVIQNIKNEEIRPNIADALRYEEATAYVTLKDYNKSLSILWNDFSQKAQTIRLDIFWAKRNWFGIMDIIEPRIPALLEEGRKNLTDHEIEQVSRLAVAYRMQEKFEKINNMKQSFSDKIINPKIRSVFEFVTSDLKPLNFQDFDNTIQLDEIETFLLEYSFWPGKEWEDIESVLSTRIELLKNKDSIDDNDRRDIVRLAIAYAMQMQSKESIIAKRSKKSLSELQRDFRAVNVSPVTIQVFKIFDNKFEPKAEDEIFKTQATLNDLPEFIPVYQSANSFSELNAAWK